MAIDAFTKSVILIPAHQIAGTGTKVSKDVKTKSEMKILHIQKTHIPTETLQFICSIS